MHPAGAIAPFEVIVLGLNNDKPDVVAEAKRIHDELLAKPAWTCCWTTATRGPA